MRRAKIACAMSNYCNARLAFDVRPRWPRPGDSGAVEVQAIMLAIGESVGSAELAQSLVCPKWRSSSRASMASMRLSVPRDRDTAIELLNRQPNPTSPTPQPINTPVPPGALRGPSVRRSGENELRNEVRL